MFILINKNKWFPVVNVVYGNKISSIILLILAAVVFYYLIQSLSIVEIIAVMAFTSLFIGAALASFGDEFLPLVKKIYKKKFPLWIWAYGLVWLALSLWALVEIFY